jgi:hypothetical protein
MPNTPSGQVSSTEPLHFSVHTLNGQQIWSYLTLHDEPPAGFDSGWALLNTLPPKVRGDLKSLCIDPENTFPAVVNGKPCVVIEQEFQASDAGDDWPETSHEVIARLTRSLLPRLERLGGPEHSFSGLVADPKVTFCGRPTLYVALPAETTPPAKVWGCLATVKDFAYPLPQAA